VDWVSSLRGYCGIDCGECNAYKATVNKDNALKAKTAAKWNEQLGTNMKPEELTCLGCKSNVNIRYCSECHIKACNETKGTEICSDCDSYPCDQITDFLKHMPEVKALLDQLYDIRKRFSK